MKVTYLGALRTQSAHDSGAIIETDAPKNNGGKGDLFSPTDLLAVSLASCMMTVMALAAEKMQIDLKGARLEVDKQMSSNPPRRIEKIRIHFFSAFQPTDEVKEKLEKSAIYCPVHHSLHPDTKIEVHFSWGVV